jgi:hypothetical protein
VVLLVPLRLSIPLVLLRQWFQQVPPVLLVLPRLSALLVLSSLLVLSRREDQ